MGPILPYPPEAEANCRPSDSVRKLLEVIERNGNPLDTLTAATTADLWFEGESQAMDVIEHLPARSEDVFVLGRNHVIPVRFYMPASWAKQPLEERATLPVLLFVHGGGWTLNSIEAYDSVTRYWAEAVPALVASVDYRLAPECPFPAGFHDVWLVLQWLRMHAAEYGGDPERIGICGDSGGANLATAVTIAVKNAQGSAAIPDTPAFQLLIYPSTDLTRMDRPSYRQFGAGHLLTTRSVEVFRALYAPDSSPWTDWRLSPFLTPMPMLAGMPRSIFIMAGCDPLRDEGKAYADRLTSAKVDVTCCLVPGMIHAFLLFFNVKAYAGFGSLQEEVRAILDQAAAMMRETFGASRQRGREDACRTTVSE